MQTLSGPFLCTGTEENVMSFPGKTTPPVQSKSIPLGKMRLYLFMTSFSLRRQSYVVFFQTAGRASFLL